MFTRHKSKESVRNYLFGKLPEPESSLLEERYFSDPAFFEWIRGVEEDLIEDYLRGHLSAEERRQFEERYLEIPDLKKRLEEVRARIPDFTPHTVRRSWQFAFTAVVVAGCGVSTWFLLNEHGAPENAGKGQPTPALAVLAVHLTPGLTKGAGERQVEFVAPTAGKVRLTFELPGLRSPVACQVRLTIVGSDSRRDAVWTSGRLQSEAVGNSQEVQAEVDSGRLRPGDYVGEVLAPEGAIRETYAFRVDPSQ
jgi:hypothetical protein